MPHYRKITEQPDYRLDWAFKTKGTGKQRKLKKEKPVKYQKKKKRYNPKKKKLRGAAKKEFLRKEKAEFPYGRPMAALRDVPPYRPVIYSKDVQKIMGLSPRGARQYLARMRKELGKQKGEVISITEFCNKTTLDKAVVIPHLVD